jgi:hypothetical protein
MVDHTEALRREMVKDINAVPGSREALEAEHGQVWDTDEMQREFTALSFAAPFIVVRRKSDDRKGTLTFQHGPRLYWGFVPT